MDFEIKREPLYDDEPEFGVKNENQVFLKGLEVKTEKLDQMFVVKKVPSTYFFPKY